MSIVLLVVIACHWFHQRVRIASLSFYTTLTAAGHSSLLSMSSLIPVPCQRNGYDCGVYVCRYAYGLYVMKHLLFTWCDYTKDPPFNTLITGSDAFKVSKSDIKRIRGEMSTLIDNLSELYLPMLEEQEKADRVVVANINKNDKPNKRHGNDDFYVSVSEDYLHKLICFYLLNGLDRWICTSCRGEVSSLMVPCQICKSFIRFVPLEMDEFKKFAKSKGCIPCWEKESMGRVVGDLQLQSLSDQGLHDETGRKCALCTSNLR